MEKHFKFVARTLKRNAKKLLEKAKTKKGIQKSTQKLQEHIPKTQSIRKTKQRNKQTTITATTTNPQKASN